MYRCIQLNAAPLDTVMATSVPAQPTAPSPPPVQQPVHHSQPFPDDIQLRLDTETTQQRRLINQNGSEILRIGQGYYTVYNHPQRHRLGPLKNCSHCTAPKWPGEAPTVCCNSGQVELRPFDHPPAELQQFFNSPSFIKDIRKYNNAFAFTSMEITENLFDGQNASDRPDLTARVFHLKLNAILADLQKGVLGVEVGRMYVIEFQKRGLPHAHLLLILGDNDKPRTPEDFDKFVSAEIPDPANEQLYQTVIECMMHGPCGENSPHSPCMTEGVCSKNFPKSFCERTHVAENGYPAYRRKIDERTVTLDGVTLDNRHVVPYNPWLVHKFNCHINVEICTSITGVMYLYKYIYQGNDRATIFFGSAADEINYYLNARFVSACEACWRIMRFVVQAKSHTVIALPIHLLHQQSVLFRPGDSIEEVLERGKNTMLTSFFDLAAHDDFARTLLYHEVPMHYRYSKPTISQRQPWHSGTGKQWVRRIRNDKKISGRMVYCSITDMERYCLRLLLCYRKGPTSFQDLRTVRGTVCATYQLAAAMEGLLEDDSVWDQTLREAASFEMPRQLRNMFGMLLMVGQLQNPRLLWDKYADECSKDFRCLHRDRQYTADDRLLWRDVEHFQALCEIDRYLRGATPAKSLSCYAGMPQLSEYGHVQAWYPLRGDSTRTRNPLIDAERQYPVGDLNAILATVHLLNADQRAVYDQLTVAVDNTNTYNSNRLFFLDGPGGTGKSYLLEKILAYTRRQGKIALATATSGIAALLLSGGKTVHSTFKLPLDLDHCSTCSIPMQSKLAELMRETKIIVWDEAPMASRYALEAIDRTLQDITGVQQPFGGKVVLLSGDFRQLLPIVHRGTEAQIIDQCIKRSVLWSQFTTLRLGVNMRVRAAPNVTRENELQQFADFLLQIGEGDHDICPGLDSSFAKLPPDMVLPHSDQPQDGVRSLISKVYPELDRFYREPDYFAGRSILSPCNDHVMAINYVVLNEIPEPLMEYRSIDTLVNLEEQESLQLPPEFLNSLNISGIPQHHLRLKKYAPVLLLRNLSSDIGLCNGTRLQIVEMKANCIHARILTGKRQGDDVLLPRMNCDSNGYGLPFQIRRKQFPIQL
ncbi:uncharacterized protein LOC121601111, partial [Anopheles merus]|uniref:uncharacterized protein LOC121601111 n=1 Tax=Anopheles merus TaxID=30066 RepID=UPI001BE4A585